MADVRSLSVKLALALLMIPLPATGATDDVDVDDDDDEAVALTAGWDGDVAFIKSSDGAFFMELGGRIHLDFRAYTADFAPPPTFLVRRARLQTEGVLYRMFEFKIQADFADDESILLRDGFVNIHAKDVVQVMAGQSLVVQQVRSLPGELQLGDVPSPTEPTDHGNDELRFPDPPEYVFLKLAGNELVAYLFQQLRFRF